MAAATLAPRPSRRQIAAVIAGNGLEFYDFVTYSFFAVQIGRTLFPGDAAHSLLLSLATFGVGFVTRPLGGIVIGRMADRRGRKPAMILTFALMGVAIVGLALTPSYRAIGMAAPVLAVLFRLLQGFSLGGEVGPSVAWLLESAPPNRRGFFISLQFATADAAVLAAGLVGFALSSLLAPADLDAWGWRLAFLLGALIVPFGLALRRSLPETLDAAAATPARGSARPYLAVAAAGLVLLGAATISNYTLSYLTTYAQATLHMAVPAAFGATVVLGLVGVVGDLSAGWLADRYGCKRVLLGPWLLLLLLAVPAFLAMSALRNPQALLGATALLSLLHILGSTPASLLFMQALPAHIRAGGIGIIYALSISLFGGTTQLVETALIGWTGNPVAPAWYMAGAIALGLLATLAIREPSKKNPLPAGERAG
jgi:MFS family permease